MTTILDLLEFPTGQAKQPHHAMKARTMSTGAQLADVVRQQLGKAGKGNASRASDAGNQIKQHKQSISMLLFLAPRKKEEEQLEKEKQEQEAKEAAEAEAKAQVRMEKCYAWLYDLHACNVFRTTNMF